MLLDSRMFCKKPRKRENCKTTEFRSSINLHAAVKHNYLFDFNFLVINNMGGGQIFHLIAAQRSCIPLINTTLENFS